jgi:hypothetical protein
LWRGDESVYDPDGKRESSYHPDPLGRVVLDDLARALGGRSFDEGQPGVAASALREAAGTGPTTATAAATPRRVPLAPYLAALALVLLMIAVTPMPGAARAVQSRAR